MTCKFSVEGYIILPLCFVKCECYLKNFKLILCPNELCIVCGVLVYWMWKYIKLWYELHVKHGDMLEHYEPVVKIVWQLSL